MILIDKIDEGTWLIKLREFIPDSEKWLQRTHDKSKFEKALIWAEKNKPKDNFNHWVKKIIKVRS